MEGCVTFGGRPTCLVRLRNNLIQVTYRTSPPPPPPVLLATLIRRMSLFSEAIGRAVCSASVCQTCTSPSHFFVRLIVRFLTLSFFRSLSLAFSHTQKETNFSRWRDVSPEQITTVSHSLSNSLLPLFPFSPQSLNLKKTLFFFFMSLELSTDFPLSLLLTTVKLIQPGAGFLSMLLCSPGWYAGCHYPWE